MNAPDPFPPGQAVPSPCIGTCRLDEGGRHCTGCLRTLEEITAWSRASDEFRRAVWRRINTVRTGTPEA